MKGKGLRKGKNNNIDKWYDTVTKHDLNSRGMSYNLKKKIDECGEQIKKYVINNNVFNCNLESAFDYFQKIDWKKELT